MIHVIIIGIVVYLLSLYGTYMFVQKSHYDIKGKWKILTPTNADIFITFCPLVNTMGAMLYIFGAWKEERSVLNFFRPNK